MPPHFAWTTDGTTFTTPGGLAFTFMMGFLLIVLPRKYALLPVIALVCYMTMGMRVMVAGLNFTMIRILLSFGWIRVLLRQEFGHIKFVPIDWTIVWFTISSVVTYTLLWGTYDALKWTLGSAYNVIGFYFLFRCLLRGMEDVSRLMKMLALLIVPLAGLMLMERATGRNVFAVFGGVPEMTFLRDGKRRCEGPFAHPILAGTFGATLFPYFVALWWQREKNKWIALVGMASALVIIVTCASSGPLFAWLAGCIALGMWPWHKYMRVVRWGIVVTLVSLQMVMKVPIWFPIARVDIVSGSTGWHRAYLIDRWIYNFWDWWLVGTKSTAAWANADAHLYDVTNQYVAISANGGLITLILFGVMLVRCFRGVGLVTRAAEQNKQGMPIEKMVWALGAALLAHAVSYISIAYFDQNFVNWYLLLAMIATVSACYKVTKRRVLKKAAQEEPLPSFSVAQASLSSGPGTMPDAVYASGVGHQPSLKVQGLHFLELGGDPRVRRWPSPRVERDSGQPLGGCSLP